MTIQLFGTRKCPETRKAERFLKDRGIDYQFRDLGEKPPSPGELTSIAAILGTEALIDRDSREWREGGWAYREFDAQEALIEHPGLYRKPILRSGTKACAGGDAAVWKAFLEG